MAAKSQRGTVKKSFSSDGKPYFFDVGIADEMAVCYSCHAGGGVAEGIVKEDGTVTPYNDPSLSPVHTYDRDFYSYDSDNVTYALNSGKSIEQTIADIGAPQKHDWSKSGVMENDCLLCHIDPDYSTDNATYTAADGLKVQPFRPRLMIFAERDANGKVTKISLGMAPKDGVQNSSALNYTNDVMRMTRPIGAQYYQLAQLPKSIIGGLFKIWTDGLKAIDATGQSLPYALYGDPQIIPSLAGIYDANGVKDEYTYNPNGGADEMQKIQANQQAIGAIFQQMLDYMNTQLNTNMTMEQMQQSFFNDFVYGYEIRDPGTGALLPIPYPLRHYVKGKFYTDWDDPDASVRDYMRSPLIEGEGIQYSGLVGVGWAAFQYAYGLMMKGDMTYYDQNSFFGINLSKVIADWTSGNIDFDTLKNMSVKHDYLPYFFNMMPTAGLMGLDFNHDGYPITYVEIVKNGNDWQAKAYYNKSDLGDGSVNINIIGKDEANSWKWIKICGQCHVMTQDHGNSEWTRGRTYNLGMPADWVKNGQYINFTNDEEAPGYDVHMSGKKMGCGTCHFREKGSLEDMHNFLKGTDTAHMVRNDLDNNPKPKTCEYCHLMGGDPNAPNPNKIHEEKFGSNTEKHITEIACKTCHIPYSKTWRFRAFDDTLGYYSNFDNRFGYYILKGGLSDFPAMAFPPYYALSPVYGTSPGYGIPHFQMVAQSIDADGKGIQPMDYLAQMVDYFWFNSESDTGDIVNGLMTNPKFDFWKKFYQLSLDRAKSFGLPVSYDNEYDHKVYPPLYWANGSNGYPQIVIGNPITILTWVDTNPGPDDNNSKYFEGLPYNGAKVLYLREINAAIDKFLPVSEFYAKTPSELENMGPQACKDDPNIGKVILKDSGYVICDHTGDGFPELWWPEDVQAMREALIKVLKAEGETNPNPVLFIAAHYFSNSHGVLPAEKALGAKSCYDCHGDYTKEAGAHRITDRIIGYVPWAPEWFKDSYRVLKYDEKTGKMVPDNTSGLFVVDGEVAYIKPVEANGVKFLGAEAKDILSLSKHHAEELFTLANKGEVTGANITENFASKLTADEQKITFVKQIVNGPWSDAQVFYIPKKLAEKITALGFSPGIQYVMITGGKQVKGYVLRVEFEEGVSSAAASDDTFIIKLPFTGTTPAIYYKGPNDMLFSASDAQILDQTATYVVVKASKAGEYIAVDTASASTPTSTANKAYSSGGGGGGCSLSPNAKFDPTLLLLAFVLYMLHIKCRKREEKN